MKTKKIKLEKTEMKTDTVAGTINWGMLQLKILQIQIENKNENSIEY